jgi:protein-L-isoaspartate O-methyltransferase
VVPEALKQQLTVGGRLIIPLGPYGGVQRLMRIVRISAAAWTEEDLGAVQFVPFVIEEGHNGQAQGA